MIQTRGILRNAHMNLMTDHHNNSSSCKSEFDASSGSKESTKSTTSLSSVSFESVTIREYAPTIGDNPSCSHGAPISIGWSYNVKATVPIEDYEKHKPPRRHGSELKMPGEIRNDILLEWDHSLSRILVASIEAQKVRNQRSKSAQTFTRRQIVKNYIKKVVFNIMPKVLYKKAASSGIKSSVAVADRDAARRDTKSTGTRRRPRKSKILIVEIPSDFPIQSADDVLEDVSMGDSGSDEDDLSYGSLQENDGLSTTHHRHISFKL